MIEPSNVADFHAAGEGTYWWHDPVADTLVVTDTFAPPTPDSVYLMPWDGPWFAQWGENWDAAADQLNSVIARQEEAED